MHIQWYHFDFSLFDLFEGFGFLTIRFYHEMTGNWTVVKENLSLNYLNWGMIGTCVSLNGSSSGVCTHIHTISTPPQSLFMIMFSSVQISWENARKLHIKLFSLFPQRHMIKVLIGWLSYGFSIYLYTYGSKLWYRLLI